MERITNQRCPRCERTEMNIYFSSDAGEDLGARCENCNLKGYFEGSELIPIIA